MSVTLRATHQRPEKVKKEKEKRKNYRQRERNIRLALSKRLPRNRPEVHKRSSFASLDPVASYTLLYSHSHFFLHSFFSFFLSLSTSVFSLFFFFFVFHSSPILYTSALPFYFSYSSYSSISSHTPNTLLPLCIHPSCVKRTT